MGIFSKIVPRVGVGAILVLGTWAAPVQAAGVGQASAGKAIALKALSIVKLRDLDFGTILSSTTAGTIVLDPFTDARSSTGGSLAAGGVSLAAQFYTYGTANLTLSVTRGPLPILNRIGGGATMNVTQLTLNGPVTRFLTSAGILDLRVGGTLAVAANQLSGDYTGTFQINVTYF